VKIGRRYGREIAMRRCSAVVWGGGVCYFIFR
jgi:hypothetical protein